MSPILIACPHPTLTDTIHSRTSAVIAVNDAVRMTGADYWCFGDRQMFDRLPAEMRPSAGLCVPACLLDTAQHRGLNVCILWEDLDVPAPNNDVRAAYSAVAAVALAIRLTTPVIAGIEMHGAPMLPDGDEISNRTMARFADEAVYLARIAERSRVPVRRIVAPRLRPTPVKGVPTVWSDEMYH